VAYDRLGIPIQHHHDVDLPKPLHQDLGHVNAPPLVGFGGSGFAARGRPLGFQPEVGLYHEAVFLHQPQNALFVDRLLLHKAQIRPDAAVTPERVLGLEQTIVTVGHQGRFLPAHPSTSSLFFNSRTSFPTSFLSRAFSRSERLLFGDRDAPQRPWRHGPETDRDTDSTVIDRSDAPCRFRPPVCP
jgi:hypothetical protein